jgi:hypothetical protein
MPKSTWLTTAQPNLLQHSGNGRYYARYELSGRRTIKALKTDKFAVAKQRIREMLADVDRAWATNAAAPAAAANYIPGSFRSA